MSDFTTEWEKNRSRLRGLLYRILGPQHDADDAVQDLAIHLFTRWHLFNGKSKSFTWMYRCAVNFALMRLRKRDVLAFTDELYKPNGSERFAGRSHAPGVEARLDLRKATAGMRADDRQLLIDAYVLGMSIKELQQKYKITTTAVKARLFHAKCRQRLKISRKKQPRAKVRL